MECIVTGVTVDKHVIVKTDEKTDLIFWSSNHVDQKTMVRRAQGRTHGKLSEVVAV